MALSDSGTQHSHRSNSHEKHSLGESVSSFPFPSLSLRLGSSSVCQVSAPAQPSLNLSKHPIVVQGELMIQQVLDMWSLRKYLPGIWTVHCPLPTFPANKCFTQMSGHLNLGVVGLAWGLGLMVKFLAWVDLQLQEVLGIFSETQMVSQHSFQTRVLDGNRPKNVIRSHNEKLAFSH